MLNFVPKVFGFVFKMLDSLGENAYFSEKEQCKVDAIKVRFVSKVMDSVLKMMNFVSKVMDSVLKMMNFVFKTPNSVLQRTCIGKLGRMLVVHLQVFKFDEFCIKSDEFRIKNDGILH